VADSTLPRTADLAVPADAAILVSTIAAREWERCRDVAEHAERVAATSRDLASALGMRGRDLEVLAFAARMHDVGKTLVDPAVLRKPGRLDDKERAHMQEHARLGADLLACVGGIPPETVEVARYHHERYDGYGYEGLAGEDIPFLARIVEIADVHDALRSPRDYKAGIEEGEVLSMMAADVPSPGFGRRAFDPVLLRRFVAMRLDMDTSIDPDVAASLRAFSVSVPAADLPPGPSAVEFHDDGSRTVRRGDGTEFTYDTAGREVEPDFAHAAAFR
jgi:HD-GYP domain